MYGGKKSQLMTLYLLLHQFNIGQLEDFLIEMKVYGEGGLLNLLIILYTMLAIQDTQMILLKLKKD